VRNIAGHPLSYLNPPVTVSADATKLQIGFDWLLDIHALSQFFSSFGMLLTLAGFTLIILLILFIPQVHQRIESILPTKKFAHVFSLVYLFLLVILAYLTLTLYVPINFMTILFSPERVLGNVFIPAIILTATILFLAVYLSYFTFKRMLGKGEGTILLRSKRNKLLVYALLALLIFNVGLSSIPIVTEQQNSYKISRSSFNTFETLGAGDVSLMKWISQNIALDANILVSSGDSGQFVSSVTQRPTISRYSPFENFGDLILLLSSNSSDLKAVPLMIEFNVSYVYIGSIATTYGLGTYYYRHFNATQFLATPYFTLTKEVDNAWLFQFNASSALSAFNNYGSTD
jgi:hypothetical protein